MSTGPLADRCQALCLDVAELVRTGADWQRSLPLDTFERLCATVNGGGQVEVAVRFARDNAARARVTGRCRANAEVVCARCGAEADVEVTCDVDFRLVASEAQARALMPALDTVVASEDQVSVAALVEDDLLLNLPEFGCSDRDSCANWAEQRPGLDTSADARSTSPFAVLGTWKVPE